MTEFKEWIILSLAVIAFILAIKFISQFAPDTGPLATVKSIINSI